MLSSKKMIFPSKFNVKLQKKNSGGVSTPYQHPVAMYDNEAGIVN
jgi:hypothetical protein